MKLSELTPHPGNPRKITDQKLKMLKASLEEFGDLSAIVFNKQTKRLTGGHQRLKVLPPDAEIILTQKYDEPTRCGTIAEGFVVIRGERFTYREVDWDETKEKAGNLAANKGAGEWDMPQLTEWLLELDHLNYDMDLTGFGKEELENIMAPAGIEAPNIEDFAKLEDKKIKFYTCPYCEEEFEEKQAMVRIVG